jgi:CDP-glycerol glycerophosphotransferase (TagB/SpsB family)
MAARRLPPLREFAPPLGAFASALAGWLLLWPLTLVVRRRSGLVVFFGRDGGKFIDNAKHLFATLQDHAPSGLESVYLAADNASCGRLRALGARAERVGSFAAWMLWLRAGTIVVDSIDWSRGLRYAGSRGARLVQLWHGIPLKQLQLPLFEERLRRLPRVVGPLLRLQRAVIGRFPRLAWMLSTSRVVTDVAFAGSFHYERISHAGYPRNDVLLRPGNALAELGVDGEARAALAAFRAAHPGARAGIYAPTFRDSFEDPFAAGRIDPAALSAIATRLGILLLVKLHPWMHGRLRTGHLPGLHFVAPQSDAYPLLRELDFLLTDYSSIYFDFLLLDRPVVFFPYDLPDYLAGERPMYFDYDAMTPGPKARDLVALEAALADLANAQESWRAERARVRGLVFDHVDGHAGERLVAELFPGAVAAR